MNSVKIISESIKDSTYFTAVKDTYEFLSKDGNGMITLEKIIHEIEKVKENES